MKRIGAVLAVVGAILLHGVTGYGAEPAETEVLVDKATSVVHSFAADPDLEWFREKATQAKALLIIPQNLKGALFIGGSGGSGVLVAQDAASGKWGYPAFYSMASVSIGAQVGAEASEVILMVMTERGMEKLLTNSFKLGADITLAAGPVGGGAAAQTADILSYSRSKGAFAGMSFDGSIVETRDTLNEAYYGRPVSPTDIIIGKSVTNPHADSLRAAIDDLAAQ